MTERKELTEQYDVIVIGAGHAGCEAALACARLGLSTIVLTLSIDNVAFMPCNPHIGGSSKGHLVREIDALGGEMGKNIDRTFLQSRMLNTSKGPAVHSLRAQADKQAYSAEMRRILEQQEGLSVKQAEVTELITEPVSPDEGGEERLSGNPAAVAADQAGEKETTDCRDAAAFTMQTADGNTDGAGEADATDQTGEGGLTDCRDTTKDSNSSKAGEAGPAGSGASAGLRVTGVRIATGLVYEARAVIICTGTYGKSRCLCGESVTETGPNGLQRAVAFSDSMRACGIQLRRFKTGTPARMDGRSVDYSKMEPQNGDVPVIPFSYSTDPATIQREQVPCYLTWTNARTHEIIRENLDRSPIYAGIIEGVGPRYCPSIEDKVVKFPEHERHQVFIEPEGRYTNEVYVDGMSSSMPEDVQVRMYRTVPGLENARIVKNAYAIEYDCLSPGQLKLSLELKSIRGLFFAGQINGSSGYEEAAAQGLIAGVNAAMKLTGREPLIIDRSEGYIGVLIDDLVTKENREPYRMMTSRAEYRLLLRQDNADLRLREKGHDVGLISEEELQKLQLKRQQIEQEKVRLKKTTVGAGEETRRFLEANGSTPLKSGATLAELLTRPELSYEALAPLDRGRPALPAAVTEQVEIDLRYAGYIERQERQVKQFKKAEARRLPEDIDYRSIRSLRLEAQQKLNQFKPANIGQASRLAGVTPADVSVLLVWLESRNR